MSDKPTRNDQKIRIPLRFDTGENRSTGDVREILQKQGIHTVCQEAACPNLWQCFSSGTATFLILGDRCTRNCRFCNIETGKPLPPDPSEPESVATAVQTMKLQYVVITSVTRDDLEDGGSGHFQETVQAIRRTSPDVKIELLIPDFKGKTEDQDRVFACHPDVLNHNLETVPGLYDRIRPGAHFRRSLDLLERSAKQGLVTKSGLMLGFGESKNQVKRTLEDLSRTGCSIVTIGQYLSPGSEHAPVISIIPPETFQELGEFALSLGFQKVESGPRVRSSYHARETFDSRLDGI